MGRLRCYAELSQLRTLNERFEYLKLKGSVGEATFGHQRDLNQRFYSGYEWRRVRSYVIARDEGCDLGVEGFEIFDRIYIHHMNPMTVADLTDGDPTILDPEYLISCTLRTHNAIHYGDERQLPRLLVDRRPGDTWI